MEVPSQPKGKPTKPFRILIVDDQEGFRQLARALLGGNSEIAVVGEAGTGEDALAVLPVLTPSAVVLDVHLPGINGFEAARRMMDSQPGIKVVMVSGYSGLQYEMVARSLGTAGFLYKKEFSAEKVLEILRPAAVTP